MKPPEAFFPEPFLDPINDPFCHFCDRCIDLIEGEEFCYSLSLTKHRTQVVETAITGTNLVAVDDL